MSVCAHMCCARMQVFTHTYRFMWKPEDSLGGHSLPTELFPQFHGDGFTPKGIKSGLSSCLSVTQILASSKGQ